MSQRESGVRRRFSVAQEVGRFLLHVGPETAGVFFRATGRPTGSRESRAFARAGGKSLAAELPEPMVREAAAGIGPDRIKLASLFMGVRRSTRQLPQPLARY